jgi:hypothetical protein
MGPIVRATIFAVAAAALAGPAFAASADYYLKLGDVKGGSAAKTGAGHRIEIVSWSWGAGSSAKYGAVAGAHRDDSAAGDVLAKGPPDRGSVRVKVKFPWLDCKMGASYPDAVLQNEAGRYEFENVLISGCAPDSVTLDYAKVRVRGWDPEKKE